jgi:murein DD-endopeptidase MepM/ murein hydrolase activator NlpD
MGEKLIISFLVIFLVLFAAFLFLVFRDTTEPLISKKPMTTLPTTKKQPKESPSTTPTPQQADLYSPIDNWENRITKKSFGTYVTPQKSPVQPERFTGYHTAIDFETLSSEQNKSVPVFSICMGEVIFKGDVNGYGGLIIQSCTINKSSVTVLYGHVSLASIQKNKGDTLKFGEQIGFLGRGFSTETDGERKHLHLGIYKGNTINFLGYVSSKEQLNNWINPLSLLR